MPPFFDLQGGIALAAARGLAVAGLLSAFGAIVFQTMVAPKAFPLMAAGQAEAGARQLRLLIQASIALSLAGLLFWLTVQAAYLADADSFAAALAAIPEVVRGTWFGHILLLQFVAVLLLGCLKTARDTSGRSRAALASIGVALALEAGHSHAFSMEEHRVLLVTCDVLHLAGAGAWLGGLLPLLMLVCMAPPKAGATAARWFSPVGQMSIVALVASAMIQGWILVASIPGLVGTAYGWLVLVKFALFGVLFGFAWFNRYHFAPALLRNDPARAKQVLVRSIAVQTGFAILIVAAAVVLSGLPPAMHLQPLWPFSQLPSLAAVNEDPDFRREVLLAGLAIAASIVVFAVSLALHRLRLAAAILVLVVAWFAVPHLDLLFVEAYPTSYYHSPTGFSTASIVDGQALFATNCVACHGPNGTGDGPLAKSLPVPPANLTASHLWMHSDGELFWWLSHGIVTPEGQRAMPGFASSLEDDQLWALIDFIRAHNAGNSRHETGNWEHTVEAADFGITCDNHALKLSDLRGQFVRLVFGAPPPVTNAADGSRTIVVSAQTDASALGGPKPAMEGGAPCVARDETIPRAYAILAGSAAGDMAGVQVLVDPEGWLRAVQPANAAMSWNDPGMLAAEIRKLREHRIATGDTMSMSMKMGPMNMGSMKMAPAPMAPIKTAPMKMGPPNMGPAKTPPVKTPADMPM